MQNAMQFEQSASRGALSQESRSGVSHRSLDHLLAMARQYHSKGRIWQAMELYWTLSEDHPGTVESLEAQRGLLELAETCERNGAPHMARAVYERLSELGSND